MPPDIIKETKELEEMIAEWPHGRLALAIEVRKRVATIIANIGRELEARCEGLPTINGMLHKEQLMEVIRSITGISPTR